MECSGSKSKGQADDGNDGEKSQPPIDKEPKETWQYQLQGDCDNLGT